MSGAAIRASVTTCVVLLLSAVPATAQPRAGRFTVSLGAGAQAGMPTFDERVDFLRPVDQAEHATADVDYGAKAALLVDGGVAVRLTKAVGVGLSISRYQGDGRAGLTARIPHPFEFGRFREVSGADSGLDRTELGYHVQLQYSRPMGTRLRLVLAAGPTVFDVTRQIVESVDIDESYPFDTATFRSARSSAAKGRSVGFNAGADLVWTLNRSAGLGALVRYARGTADLNAPSRTVTVDVGGVQAGLGLRLYF
jgi:hypothetical protein